MSYGVACVATTQADGTPHWWAFTRTKHAAMREYAAHYRDEHPRPPVLRSSRPLYATMAVQPGVTLAEAKTWLREHVDEGARCPACDQVAKVYYRTLHASVTAQLVRFYARFGTDWGQRPQWARGGAEGDFAKLRYWGLIEESVETRPDGGRAGWWRVTELGAEFVRGERRVRRHAVVYDARRLRLEGPMVDVTTALGKRFHYNELMGRAV